MIAPNHETNLAAPSGFIQAIVAMAWELEMAEERGEPDESDDDEGQ